VAVVLAVGAAIVAADALFGDGGNASADGYRLAQSLAESFRRQPIARKLDFRLSSSGRPKRGQRVRVIVEGQPKRTIPAIKSVGGRIEGRYAQLTQALVPKRVLRRLARSGAVRFVRPPFSATPDGPIAGEGPRSMEVARWHARGLTGKGVTVAIIDFGFKGYRRLQKQKELPATLTTKDYCSGKLATAGEHGSAVAEIVHEVAPRARLVLICIDTSEVALGRAYEFANRQKARVINHSASWYTSGRGDGTGETGTPAAIVARAHFEGVLWVNSAGNRADRNHWTGTFDDPDGDGFHNFTAGDNSSTIESSGAGCFSLKWDDWPRSSEDYNLILTRADSDEIVASSVNVQVGAQRPVEEFCYSSDAPRLDLKIARAFGTKEVRLDLFSWSGAAPRLEYAEPAGSVTEPGSSPNTLAAAAICWQGNELEAYSSRGPTIDGRTKPDLAGPDSVSNSTYGASRSCGSGFTGTSASAPNVAGVAALVAQRFPKYTPGQIQRFLEDNARDLGRPGKDSETGSGKLVLPQP
jgi:subtilisin family serine protease